MENASTKWAKSGLNSNEEEGKEIFETVSSGDWAGNRVPGRNSNEGKKRQEVRKEKHVGGYVYCSYR